MPAGKYDDLDISSLERAIEDIDYRDDVLRAEQRV